MEQQRLLQYSGRGMAVPNPFMVASDSVCYAVQTLLCLSHDSTTGSCCWVDSHGQHCRFWKLKHFDDYYEVHKQLITCALHNWA